MTSKAKTLFSSSALKEKAVWHVCLMIGSLSVVILGSMGYGFWSGNHMIAGQAPMIDAAMEIKLEATTAHLWFEEVISGDKLEDLEAVMAHLSKADWYARSMLQGGENSEGVFSPLKDETLQREIIEVRGKIAKFNQITLERWDNRESAGIGTDIDQRYDRIFRDFIAQADKVETGLQQTLTRQLRNFRLLQSILIGACILVTIAVTAAIGKLVRQQVRDKVSLNSMNQQLNATNQQIKASEQQLLAVNQQLRASEQQQLAANQQLKAREQQLLAANQQLKAGGQQLRATNQQLQSEVTQRKKTEGKLRQAQKEADAATSAKSQFLASMSHEIRTPMNAIIGFSDMLADEDLNRKQKENVNIIRESASSLLNLINDILDFSKIEAGQLNVEITDCSLGKLLNSLESMMKPQAMQKSLDFQIGQGNDLPAHIQSDPYRLQQCLVNLVSNAIKFTDQGHVYVETSLHEGNNQHLIRFDVEDTGIGIPQQNQATVFESFTQADGSIARKYGGTGLGLTITRQLAELLGGELTLTSEPGKGSIFSLVIPTGVDMSKQVLIDRHNEIDHSAEESGKMEPRGFSGKVLVVEDVETNQILIEMMLSKMGLEVTIAEDGNQALQKVLSQSFDLILMDMQMPHMNGYEATRVLRRQGYKTPIVALTADAMKGDDQKCMEAGCDGYLTKPIDRRELPRMLAKYLPARPESTHKTMTQHQRTHVSLSSLVQSEILAQFHHANRTMLSTSQKSSTGTSLLRDCVMKTLSGQSCRPT